MRILKLTDLDGLPRIIILSGPAVIDPIEPSEDPGPWDESVAHAAYVEDVKSGRISVAQGWTPENGAPEKYVSNLRAEWQKQSNDATGRARVSFFTGKKRWNAFVRETFEEIERLLVEGPK